jgi:hypothetical protein
VTLHLLKLAVGIEHFDHLKERQDRFMTAVGNYQHTTRMFPKRESELLSGGSMFWVIKRLVTVRQTIIALHREADPDGRKFLSHRRERGHSRAGDTSRMKMRQAICRPRMATLIRICRQICGQN